MNIIEYIQKNQQDKRLIIGIDGLSRSGKTTYAKHVEKEYLLYLIQYLFYILTILLHAEQNGIIQTMNSGTSIFSCNGTQVN
ncbi:hypothetical protein [Bacillus mesophilum]|uniref:hypothetical protein n=1 Tax=Bacillus mesophilum TaxID=1071718 RepID=UPI001F015123|nr:hypothetical protein [Bacillus mesophilum]